VIAAIDRHLRALRDAMTPGQRWTAALALVLAIAVMSFGLPHRFVFRATGAPSGVPAREAAPTGVDRDSPAPAYAGGALALGDPGLGSQRGSEGVESFSGSGSGAAAPSVEAAGKNGDCEMTVRSIDNPRHAESAEPMPVWIYEPAGDAPGSITGGRCDDRRRPAVFIGHGFGNTDPATYQEFIEHLVSVGNVVVYPTYDVEDGERSTLEESNRVVDAGIVAAVKATPRIDTARSGWWGHSHGGGMIPYLVQQGGQRHWGERALWMSIVAQAFTQLVGAGDIKVPTNAQEMTVAFHDDALADARLGIDVYESLVLPQAQKRHVMVQSGASSSGPFVADHGAPSGGNELGVDAVDALVWRYADLLELCALFDVGCDADLTTLPGPDGSGEKHAVVTDDPIDAGPYPAVLAECDAGFGPTLNPRIERCGETHL
jgi:hypothetical protein